MATVDQAFGSGTRDAAPSGNFIDAPGHLSAPWPLWLRIVFRFVFSYVVLYCLPFPISLVNWVARTLVPGTDFVAMVYFKLWQVFIPWFSAHILHLSKPVIFVPDGGDGLGSYIQILCFVVFAAIATLIWTLLDRRRTQYRQLHEGLRIYLRYFLAFAMFLYGFAKLPYGQFRAPGFDRLIEPYGSFTPMGTLWYFIGVSKAYAIFGGIAEVTGGFLLLFRRTTTLGALVVMADMLNVAMLNYCYDVPVKIYSTSLLLLAIFLLIPDMRRLIRFFVLDRPTASGVLAFPWNSRRWMATARAAAKTVIIALALYGTLVQSFQSMRSYPSMMAKMKSPLYGIYNVEGTGSDAAGSLIYEVTAGNWRRVAFEYRSFIAVVMADDSMPRYSTKFDTAKHTIALYHRTTPIGMLTYSQPDADHLILQGTFNGQPAHLELRKIDASKYRLNNTGYHWINEFSNDR